MPAVVIFNRSATSGDRLADELHARFPDATFEELGEPDDPDFDQGNVHDIVVAAVEQRAEFVAAAGGDGTVSAVAAGLAGTAVPLLPVPVGNRNHFARDVGIADIDAAAVAARDGRVVHVDVARVNERTFVNNASIGMYAEIVGRRERGDELPARLPGAAGNVAAGWRHLWSGHRHHVSVGTRREHAWMVFVGNNRYGEGPLDVASRDRVDEGVLDVRVVRGDQRLSRLRVLVALVSGRLARSPLIARVACDAIDVDPDPRVVEVALDGEVFPMTTPLRFESAPGALRVLVPPEPRETLRYDRRP